MASTKFLETYRKNRQEAEREDIEISDQLTVNANHQGGFLAKTIQEDGSKAGTQTTAFKQEL